MAKTLLSSLLLCFALGAQAQFIVPYSGTDSSNACSGTLYDHGGATGNYSNYANGYFYINPPGSSLDITFTSFQLEGCCDYVRIYDGIGTSGTLLLIANGGTLPNGGAVINAPSGTATVRFSSDYSATFSGFALDWISSGGSATPSSSFTVSTTNPPLNSPISFTNTSSVGDYSWGFGDGTTSTDANPTHTYTAPGNYTATLTVSNCYGTSGVSSQVLTVQGSPAYSTTPDSLYASVSCGGLATGSFQLTVDSLGSMGYNISSYELPAPSPYALDEDFESSLGSFQRDPLASSSFSANRVIGSAPSGGHFIQVSGSTGAYEGLNSTFIPSQPSNISYWFYNTGVFGNDGYVVISESSTSPATSMMFYSYLTSSAMRVFNGVSLTFHSINTNAWNRVELRNINWSNNTYDFYLNGSLAGSGYSFFANNNLSSVSRIDVYSTGSNTIGFDHFQIEGNTPQPLTIVPQNGTLNVGASTTVNVSINTNGMSSGRKEYAVLVRSNGVGVDSTRIVPFIVDITGTAAISLDKSCINAGNVFLSQSYSDSIRVANSGCDTLRISSITSTSSDIVTDVNALDVAPYDTAYVYVTFSPTVIGAISDTISLVSNVMNMDVCVTGAGLGAPIVSTDSLAYHVTSVGCNDSVSFDLKLFNSGTADMNWEVKSSVGLFDDFESGTASTQLWQSIGTNNVGIHCYSNSGVYGMSFTGGNRFATTVPFNTAGNDSISFWAFPGNSGSFCENPDGGEDVFVEYSSNNGFSWTNLGTVYNYNTSPTLYSFHIPYTGSVIVRLRQQSYSSTGIDNYIFDDFRIGSAGTISFNPNTGVTAMGDSVTVTGTVDISDYVSGTYQIPFSVVSDDPNTPNLSLNLTITIQGTPTINLDNASCMDFGTVINGASVVDSVVLWNSGCDDLVLSGIVSTHPDFTAAANNTTIAPGDSTYVVLTFNSNSIGAYQDTITVNSNDTAIALCVVANGLGAPNFNVIPDSVYLSTASCDDSLSITLNVTNIGGLSTLQYTMDSLRTTSGSSTLNITILRTGADVSREYLYTYNTITSQLPTAVITESDAVTASQLQVDLSNADVFVIPELEYMNYATSIALAPEIQSYLNSGGQVVLMANPSNIMTQLGLMTSTFNTTGVPNPLNITDPTSPVFNGLSTMYISGLVRSYNITNPGLITLAHGYNTTETIIGTYRFGAGTVGYYGFDFFNYSNDMQIGLGNMIEMLAQNNTVDWAYLTNHVDSALVNDSAQTQLHVITAGLVNGRYTSQIRVTTNDPAFPEIFIPVVLDVNGTSQMELETACLEFDSLIVGLSSVDTTTIYNLGCDTLYISGSSSVNGDYAISSALPLAIAPGDSMEVEVAFSPSVMGNRDDSLTVFSNSDTLSICVNGMGLGAPALTNAPDTISLVLNKCDNFSLESFSFSNGGQGVMDYEIIFGEFYTDTTRQNFTTTSAITNHTFSGTPVLADSIVVTVVVSGDFDATWEYYDLIIEGSYQGNSAGSTPAAGTFDTTRFVLTGVNVNTWLADGVLDIDIDNNNSVGYYSGIPNFHHVKVEIYNSALPAWLTFPSATTGTLAIGASANKSMLFTATNLAPGVYTSSLSILSNDPVLPVKMIPIIFDVREESLIALSDTCLYFPTTQLGDTSTQQIWVVNDGCLPLNVTQVTSLSTVFVASPTSFTVPAGDSVAITVSFIPAVVSNYSSLITIQSNAGTETFCVNGSSDAKPTADFNFGLLDQCNGQVLFSDHSAGVVSSYFWDFGDGNFSSSQSPIHYYLKPGTYAVKLTVSNSAGFDTLTQNVTVNPLYVDYAVQMNGAFVQNDTFYIGYPIQFLDSSLTASTWKWFLGDGTTSSIQNPIHTYQSVGNYQISLEVEDTAGCKKTYSKSYWILSDIGVQEELVTDLLLYPNPSEGLFGLTSSQVDWQNVRLEVVDLRGATVYSKEQLENADKQQVDIRTLPAGVYILRVYEHQKIVAYRRLIKN